MSEARPMPLSPRTRYLNPRLGVYFGIFMSAFIGLVLLSLIFEQLGVAIGWLEAMMLAGPILLYATIGLASLTQEPLDFFAAGRRVSAFYSGLVLATSAMGATGLLALTGAFFLIGFDALCLTIGGLAGFVVMAVLLAPFLRKFGAFTIPSYLGRRFESRVLRILAAVLLAVPMLFVIAAELRMGAFAASLLWPQSPLILTLMLVATLIVTLVAGGMRSLTWSSTAQGLASLFAVMVPVAIVAVVVTNLPIPQLTHGSVLRLLGRAEVAQGLPQIVPPVLAFDFPGEGMGQVVKRFSNTLGSVGPLAFVIVMLTTLTGIASAPWLLPRAATTPGVYEARKSLGWATLLFGLTALTLASIGVFMRDYVMDLVTAGGPARIPQWLKDLTALGLASVEPDVKRLTMASMSFKRDSVLFALPIAAGMPAVLVHLAVAGAVAAALAAAGTAAVALGNVLTEDIVYGLSWETPPAGIRLAVARVAIAVAAVIGGIVAVAAPTDPLKLLLWSFALTGSTAFPLLVLSIWWKRLNVFGAIAGLGTGFAVAALTILSSEAGWIPLESALAGALAIPAGFFAAVVVTLITPSPSRHALELMRDIRIPGGEILYDREMRLERLKTQRQRG